jgi:hypothetical protein
MNGGPEIGIATRETVFRKVCGQGCTHRADLNTPVSYAFTCSQQQRDKLVDRLFFIPRELVDGGYTLGQLQEIEKYASYHICEVLTRQMQYRICARIAYAIGSWPHEYQVRRGMGGTRSGVSKAQAKGNRGYLRRACQKAQKAWATGNGIFDHE